MLSMIGDLNKRQGLLQTISFQIYKLTNLQLMLVMEKLSLTFSSINWLKLLSLYLVLFQILHLIFVFGLYLLHMVNLQLSSLKILWSQVLNLTQQLVSSLVYGLAISYGHHSHSQCLWAWTFLNVSFTLYVFIGSNSKINFTRVKVTNSYLFHIITHLKNLQENELCYCSYYISI